MVDKVNLRDSYKYYKNNYEAKVDVKTYVLIVNGLMQFIIKKLFSAFDIILPYRLGMLCIRGKKIEPIVTEEGDIRGIAPDWGKTRKLWREDPIAEANKTRIFCFNEHSNGIKYRILWLKRNAIFKNKTIYGLAVAKDNRRTFAKGVKDGAEYIVQNDV
jgi:hypothetical protein